MLDMNVLFVDDEQYTLNALRRLLRKESYGQFFALSGAEALAIMAENPIHIIATDMKMPEMDGLQLLEIIKQRFPETIRIVLSAYTQTGQLLPCINSGEVFRFITKPVQEEELRTAINDAMKLYMVHMDKAELIHSLEEKNRLLLKTLERKNEIEEQLRHLSIVDELTGLYNRRQLMHLLNQEFQQSKRYNQDLSCLLIDLDHFKYTNDTFGHTFGDLVLQQFSQRIKASLRDADIAFRYGGEEFLVLLPESDLEAAQQVGNRIVESCKSTPYVSGDISHINTVSVGVASLKECDPDNPGQLIAEADRMLYKAKRGGRNRLVCCPGEAGD
ncbi:MAG: diguanylate cyclase [Thermodesulfobacteriota bacterium]